MTETPSRRLRNDVKQQHITGNLSVRPCLMFDARRRCPLGRYVSLPPLLFFYPVPSSSASRRLPHSYQYLIIPNPHALKYRHTHCMHTRTLHTTTQTIHTHRYTHLFTSPCVSLSLASHVQDPCSYHTQSPGTIQGVPSHPIPSAASRFLVLLQKAEEAPRDSHRPHQTRRYRPHPSQASVSYPAQRTLSEE